MSHTPSGIEAIVCEDIARRQAFGVNKYGTTVADNPLDLKRWLTHAYEEALDQAIYLRRAIDQMEREQPATDLPPIPTPSQFDEMTSTNKFSFAVFKLPVDESGILELPEWQNDVQAAYGGLVQKPD